MANFMGPMAPPQAAPQTPPQLDIRTNPGQRAQFKTFMQGMSRPAAPPTTAPIAPMLPAPTPAEQIDIFAPVPMANGGLADPYAMEGKIGQSVGPKMVGGTTNVIDGSGGNDVDSMGGDAMEALVMENKNFPPLPVTGFPAETSRILSELPNIFGSYDYFGNSNPQSSDVMSPQTIGQRLNDIGRGILGATQMDGPMGGTFGIRPVTRDGNLGIMANFTVPFEDGGPVRMFMGGDPQAYGEERGRQDTSETAQERQRVGGTTNVFEGDSSPREERDETERRVNEAVAATQQAEAAQQLRDDINDSLRAEIAAQNPVDLTFGAPRTDTSGRIVTGAGQFSDDQQKDDFQRIDDVISAVSSVRDPFDRPSSLLGNPLIGDTSSAQLFDTLDAATQAAVMNPPAGSIVEPSARASSPPPAGMPGADPLSDILAGEPGTSGAGDDSLSMAVGRMLATPVTYKTARGNVTGTALDDLNRRMGGNIDASGGQTDGGFMGMGKMAVDALLGIGRGKATDIFTNIEAGRPGVIDSRTGQITGYVGDGLFGIGKAYTGRGGFNPFAPGANYTFDPSRNAYVVDYQQPNQGEDDQQRNRALPQQVAPPVTDSTPADPPVVVEPVAPSPRPDPMNVVVPSTRVADPLGLTPPAFAPVQSVGLPQSFLDLLASFNRPAPVAMQEGGAVLDRAADNFLEALKVA